MILDLDGSCFNCGRSRPCVTEHAHDQTGDHDARGNRPPYDYSFYGLRIGGDVPLGDFVVGGALGILQGDIGGGPISGDLFNIQGDLFVLARLGDFFVRAAGGIGGGQIDDIKRRSSVPGLVNDADADTFQASLSGEAGAVFEIGAVRLIPSARLDYLHSTVFGFSEDGPAARLDYSDQDSDALFGSLQLRGATTLGDMVAFVETGYEELLSFSHDGDVALVNSFGTRASVSSVDPRERGFFTNFGVSGQISDNVRVGIAYGIALHNGDGTTHGGKLDITMTF